MLILLHTSKTMRPTTAHQNYALREPSLAKESVTLSAYLKSLTVQQVQKTMALSSTKADQTYNLIQNFDPKHPTLPALDIFLGDIYSGLQASSFTQADRDYTNNNKLFILSGLYGVLKPIDQIQPYRLEMGYRLPGNTHDPSQPNITSLYEFWGDKIAKQLPKSQPIINLSAVEYTKAVLPYITGTKTIKPLEGHENTTIITPKFLTVSPKTGEPTFVTVHAKIARGAFARWLIQQRIEDLNKLKDFNEIGYKYVPELSSIEQPVFVAKEFKGLGLSVRLT